MLMISGWVGAGLGAHRLYHTVAAPHTVSVVAAGVQAWLEAWFSATGAALAATPIVVTELTVDADATSPPEQAAPGVFLARLGPQQRLHPRRLGADLLPRRPASECCPPDTRRSL